MATPSVRFEMGDYYWVAERESVGFTGTTNLGVVEFLITCEALTQLLDPIAIRSIPKLPSRSSSSSRATFTA